MLLLGTQRPHWRIVKIGRSVNVGLLPLLFYCVLSQATNSAALFIHPISSAQLSSHTWSASGAKRNAYILHSSTPWEFEDDLFLERFKRRRDEAASKIEAERLHRPPSSSTHFADPKNVVTSILDGLLRPHEPVPYFGYEILYTSSTAHWKDVLRKSVGAPIGTVDELIFRALSTSMERANNQFGILVGMGTDVDATINGLAESTGEEGYYTIEFPWDTLDYYDGTAWLECRLRDKQSDALLVVLGWSMKQRESDGSWLVDGIDWQDFREKYRPGIGREEWERICG